MGELSAAERVKIVDLATASDDFAEDVRRGLASSPKTLSPKYFYDDLGSVLFDAICRLPEYYVMRAEDEILARHGGEILGSLGSRIRLVELGSGRGIKTRRLIRNAMSRQETLRYVPIDIDPVMLTETANALAAEFDGLHVTALATVFENGVAQLPNLAREPGETTLVLFLGSTIGNLDPAARHELLHMIRSGLRAGDALLLGADSVKSDAILIPAYDDALGVTAAFNLNLLVRINRELGGTFDVAGFRHLARYDHGLDRIEMHLVSSKAQTARAAGIEVHFAEGETIHTESSYKFTPAMIESLARDSAFELTRTWTDSKHYFADYLLTAV